MSITFSEAKTFINKGIGSLKNINVVTDGTKRGAQVNATSSGVYVYSSGFTSVSGSIGETLTITLQGGNPSWEGAASNDQTAWYPTQAQIRMTQAIIDHCKAMNCSIKDDNINYGF